jgi:hypothetical protein
MAEVRLYYQERADGGARSGLYVDAEAVLHRFVPGPDEGEYDPSLTWYVDLVWQTDAPPGSADEAREWVASRADQAAAVLAAAADVLRSGVDIDLVPWQREFSTADGPVRVSVSAMRRYAAVDIGSRLRELAARWADLYPALEPAG